MNKFDDLKIQLSSDSEGYYLDVENLTSGANGLYRPFDHYEKKERPRFNVEWVNHRKFRLQIEQYGLWLGETLFTDSRVGESLMGIMKSSRDRHVRLRLRLDVHGLASKLHNLYWEALRLPANGSLVSDDEYILFSRFLSARDDFRKLLYKPNLRALVAIANQHEKKYNLPSIDVTTQKNIIQKSLKDISATYLTQDVTLANLEKQLDNNFHILYLVCHGQFKNNKSYLYLDDEQRVEGEAFVDAFTKRIPKNKPFLVFLVACESAGDGEEDSNPLVSIAPQLVQKAGIPAVIAMQGKVTVDTMTDFLSAFIEGMHVDGELDYAMAVARRAVIKRQDWWMPVLFMNLIHGRIWLTGSAPKETVYHSNYELFTDKKVLLKSLREWRTIDVSTQSLRLTLLRFHDSLDDLNIEAFSDLDAFLLEKRWFNLCEPEIRNSQRVCNQLESINHQLLDELTLLLKDDYYSVAGYINRLIPGDSFTVRQLNRAVIRLRDLLSEIQIIAKEKIEAIETVLLSETEQ